MKHWCSKVVEHDAVGAHKFQRDVLSSMLVMPNEWWTVQLAEQKNIAMRVAGRCLKTLGAWTESGTGKCWDMSSCMTGNLR